MRDGVAIAGELVTQSEARPLPPILVVHRSAAAQAKRAINEESHE